MDCIGTELVTTCVQGLSRRARHAPADRPATFDGETIWEGVLHAFELAGHPAATRGYDWSSPIEESTKRRFFAVCNQPPVDSPQAAALATIGAETRGGGSNRRRRS